MKIVAKLENTLVTAINVQNDDYQLSDNEREVTGRAWVNGYLIENRFVPPQPYPSWTLNANGDWQPPTQYPDDGGMYFWNEKTLTWEAADA